MGDEENDIGRSPMRQIDSQGEDRETLRQEGSPVVNNGVEAREDEVLPPDNDDTFQRDTQENIVYTPPGTVIILIRESESENLERKSRKNEANDSPLHRHLQAVPLPPHHRLSLLVKRIVPPGLGLYLRMKSIRTNFQTIWQNMPMSTSNAISKKPI